MSMRVSQVRQSMGMSPVWFLFLFVFVQQGGGEKRVPLQTEIPKARFLGRAPVKLYKLEPVEKSQPALMVPPGLANLARGKRVRCSTRKILRGDLAMVTDGSKEGDRDSYLELEGGHQWIQIDLGKEQEIFALWMWHYLRALRAYVDVVVWVSNDQDFADGTETVVYHADHDNSSGLGIGDDAPYVETNRGRWIDCRGVKARYVRLHSNGNTANEENHYVEVEVWGRAPKE